LDLPKLLRIFTNQTHCAVELRATKVIPYLRTGPWHIIIVITAEAAVT
jgi:hypothetical protein